MSEKPTSRDTGAGKGDKPRNISPKFRDNFDQIDWKNCQGEQEIKKTSVGIRIQY